MIECLHMHVIKHGGVLVERDFQGIKNVLG